MQRNVLKLFDRSEPAVHLTESLIQKVTSHFIPPVQTDPRPTQPSVKWVPGLSWGEERPGFAADHSPLLMPWSRQSRAVPQPTLWATPSL